MGKIIENLHIPNFYNRDGWVIEPTTYSDADSWGDSGNYSFAINKLPLNDYYHIAPMMGDDMVFNTGNPPWVGLMSVWDAFDIDLKGVTEKDFLKDPGKYLEFYKVYRRR